MLLFENQDEVEKFFEDTWQVLPLTV